LPPIDAADPNPLPWLGLAWFALVSTRASLAVDIYRSREAADAELRDALEDEPD
jgi:hypothetical protein